MRNIRYAFAILLMVMPLAFACGGDDDDDGFEDPAQFVATLTANALRPRLVVLQLCDFEDGNVTENFERIAPDLIRGQVPAVLALQYAAIAGGRVIAVDVLDEKLELARELGAEFTVNAAKEDPAEAIMRLGGADQAIALAVTPRAFEQAYGSLRRNGTLVFVGLPAENTIELPIFETVLNGITVVGSIVGTRVDLREVFELHAAGTTRVIREVRPLAEVNEAIADVAAGRVPARVVFGL